MAGTEFWRELKPITNVFKSDALPEVYLPDAPTEDERYYVPFTETVGTRPLWISPSQNRWCDVLLRQRAPAWSTATTTRSRSSPTRSPASGATWSTTGSRPPATSSTRRRARRTRSSRTSTTSRCRCTSTSPAR